MSDDTWTRADEALCAALDAAPEERAEVLDRVCAGDPELRERVERLLKFAEDDSPLARPDDLMRLEDRKVDEGLRPGVMLGPFEIKCPLGSGGMGEVYRARDSRIGREVAVKVLPADVTGDLTYVERFMREARIVSRLNHPNILTIHEVDRCEAGLYIVSEMIDGSTLRQIARNRTVSVDEAVDIFRQVANGLSSAHAADIVHRDIKPANIMVTHDGIVKILDFGIAKAVDGALANDGDLTRTGATIGTPGYIAPEILRGEPFDGRSDLFALGVVIYELLAGRHPFPGSTVAQTFDAVLNRTPEPLNALRDEVPAELAALLASCLEKRVDQRPADAGELLGRLDAMTRSSSETARQARGILGRISDLVGNVFRENRGSGDWQQGDSREPAKKKELVVALMPIEDRTGDPQLEALDAARVVTDLFLHLLTDGAGLHTVAPLLLQEAARSTGERLSDATTDLTLARKLGKRVGGNAMLSGALEKISRTYVVTATIAELDSGRVRRSYRAQANDWDGLLAALAANVAQERDTPRSTSGERLVDKIPSQSLEAYACFVRGRDLADLGQHEEALPSFERAVELDPELALAWSEMGCAYYFAGDMVRSRAAHWKAAEHLNHASLKERLWIAATTAWVHTENGSLFRRRLRDFIEAFPDDRDGPFYMGHSYIELDNAPDKALPWLERAYAMTPSYYPIARELAIAHQLLGEREKAREVLQRFLEQSMLTEHARTSAEAQLKELSEEA